MDIIKYRYIFFAISGVLILASVAAAAFFGLKQGIDFTGGTFWQIKLTNNQQPTTNDLNLFFENELNVKNATIYQESENQSFIIRLGHISEEEHRNYLQALKTKFNGEVEELRYETVGPSIGRELRSRAVWAAVLVMLGISVYVIYAFYGTSSVIKSWRYGLITLLTLFHDAVISVGTLAFLGFKFGIELDTKFVVALLVIVGFSVHDTIVVFDRIRENLSLSRGRAEIASIVNFSIKQTMSRSINTSLTLVLVLLALFFFGPVLLKYFALIIMVGTIVGTYSSIFIASPLLIFRKEN